MNDMEGAEALDRSSHKSPQQYRKNRVFAWTFFLAIVDLAWAWSWWSGLGWLPVTTRNTMYRLNAT